MNSRKLRPTQADNTTYSALVPGQHVVLVMEYAKNRRPYIVATMRGNTFPVKGIVYTIREVFVDPRNQVALRLVEIVNPVLNYSVDKVPVGRLEMGFEAHRFRPLPRLKVEDFMSANAPREDKRVPA